MLLVQKDYEPKSLKTVGFIRPCKDPWGVLVWPPEVVTCLERQMKSRFFLVISQYLLSSNFSHFCNELILFGYCNHEWKEGRRNDGRRKGGKWKGEGKKAERRE